jgi:hypothetical protein
LYSEVAVIGLEDQGTIYDELWRRIPIMAGFNVPTFKILDVLSIELEWYNWNYRNSYSTYLFAQMLPLPDQLTPVSDWKENSLKWSVYAKRNIGDHFSVIGQIAYDHMQLERNVFMQNESYYGDAMHKHGDWAWLLKIAYGL